MNFLPDEILLQIISFLEPSELVVVQYVSRQFLDLGRDNSLWKQLCFEHSVAERRRRRQLLTAPLDIDPRLAELVRAADSIAGGFIKTVPNPDAPSAEMQAHRDGSKKNAALLANWDPTYSGENVNFYQEFTQRHAPHSISWFQNARHGHQDDNLHHEATGAGILFDDSGMTEKLVASLEDGSISIWDASGSRQGGIIARSSMGLLTNKGSDLDNETRLQQSKAAMTETGAVECISIDSRQKKGFFAVQNVLNEVDLETLRVISRTQYPFPITALSEAHHPTPLTVGTNYTIHLHDTRKPPSGPTTTRGELIGGSSPNSFSRLQTRDFGGHVSLSQPGPLSILHLPTARGREENGDIWVGGRFTSLLNFDRRFFPKLRGTVHSGARLSCITAIPHPFIPHDLRNHGQSFSSSPSLLQEAKSIPGHTLIAAGEYKLKGSLELYSLSSDPARSIISSDSSTFRNHHAYYQNRQTASSSKLLSVAPHGSRLVFSDGDGMLKWVERDASTSVRQLNINDTTKGTTQAAGGLESGWGDIVQKIIPTISPSLQSATTGSAPPLGHDNLIIWTGDGKLGMLGFGSEPTFDINTFDGMAEEELGKQLRHKERQYGVEMRRALEHQARELKWLKGYGL